MRTLAFLPVAIATLGCGSQVYWDDRADERSGPPEGCGEVRTMVITGTVGGAPVQIDAPFAGNATSAGVIAFAEPSGETAIFTPRTFFPNGDPDPSTSFFGGSSPSAVVTIQPAAAAGGPLSGICDAGDPVVTFTPVWVNGRLRVYATTKLASLRKLGVCPGAPVDAKLQISLNPDTTPSSSLPFQGGMFLTGTVGGASFQAQWYGGNFGYSWLDPGTLPTGGEFFEGGGFVEALPDGGRELSGILVMPAGSPDPGAVYCVGSSESLDGGAVTVLSDLSRLGTCADAPTLSGSLSVCATFDN
jgi:hypothetical protein